LDESNKNNLLLLKNKYNDLLNDKSGILKTLRQQEDSDLKSQNYCNRTKYIIKVKTIEFKEIGGESIGATIGGIVEKLDKV
jgi:hypothetical protein